MSDMKTFQTECKKLDHLKYEMNIHISAEQVQKAFDQEYKNVQKKISVPGFRKGKVPLSYIRKNYFEKIQYDVLNFLLEKSYAYGLNQNNLNPAGSPHIDFKPLNENEDFNCKMLFEVHPQIELEKFENFDLKIKKSEVTSNQVDQVVEDLRDSHSKIVPLKEDRLSKKGDIVYIDLSGKVEGDQDLPPQKDLIVELGKNRVMKDIEDNLTGLSVGSEKKIHSHFPKEHLRFPSKKVEFLVKVKKLSIKIQPEINDEWAKKLNEKDLESLKKNIFQRLQDQANQYDQEQLRQEALNQLIDKNPIDIPDSVISSQKKHLIFSVRQRLKKQGLSEKQVEDYIQKNKTQWDEQSKKNARASYLIQTLIRKLKIEEKQDPVKGVDPALIEKMHWQKVQTKALDYIVEKSNVIS